MRVIETWKRKLISVKKKILQFLIFIKANEIQTHQNAQMNNVTENKMKKTEENCEYSVLHVLEIFANNYALVYFIFYTHV